MMDDGNNRPIIRVVKKVSGHGHHGGAWKVAYADFVTAMMAFFLVMWVVGMDQPAQDSIQAYFNDPAGYTSQLGRGTGVLMSGNALTDFQSALVDLAAIRRERERRQFEEMGQRLRATFERAAVPEALTENVQITVTEQGLRIELAETDAGPTFFALGSADLTESATALLELVADELARVENSVIVEGHTDARPLDLVDYSNWELSNDRANAARRMLEAGGLDPSRVIEVRGYADRELAVPDDPNAAANRRVSILLPFSQGMSADTPTESETSVFPPS